MNISDWANALFPPRPPASGELLQPATWPLALIGFITVSSVAAFSLSSNSVGAGSIPSFRGFYPWQRAWQFFTQRHDFLKSGFERCKGDFFQFRVNKDKVIAMKGEAARKFFYGDKTLSVGEGYKILMGGVPRLSDIDIQDELNNGNWLVKNLGSMLRPERLTELTPQLFADLERRIGMWPEEGTFDPFNDVYDARLVFQLTARAAAATEIADDPALVSRISELFFTIERGSNPRAMIFPYLPNAKVQAKNKALRELFGMFAKIIEQRKATRERKKDAVQMLLDDGLNTEGIVSFVLATLFAGVINTGINAAWTLLFLAAHPDWKTRATAEVQGFLNVHAPVDPTVSPTSSLASRLAQIPPTSWEGHTPTLDLIIRESIRIMSRGAALRRNLREDVLVDGRKIKSGAFLAHPAATIHFDESVYTNPEVWDPGRYEEGREEDRKVAMGFVGWGAGRHPCAGKRFAQLEIKAILALFLLGIEYTHVDGQGRRARVQASDVDRNNLFAARPKGTPTYIKYKKMAL